MEAFRQTSTVVANGRLMGSPQLMRGRPLSSRSVVSMMTTISGRPNLGWPVGCERRPTKVGSVGFVTFVGARRGRVGPGPGPVCVARPARRAGVARSAPVGVARRVRLVCAVWGAGRSGGLPAVSAMSANARRKSWRSPGSLGARGGTAWANIAAMAA